MTTYLRAQVAAGAQALQIFDSWAGALGRTDYREFVLPHTKRIFDGLASAGVPLIHFGVGATAILPDLVEAGGHVIGVDWRQGLDDAWKTIGPSRGIQGNLDPARLFGPRDRLLAAADDILRQSRRPTRTYLQSRPRRAAADARREPAGAGRPRPRQDADTNRELPQPFIIHFSIQHSAFRIAFVVVIVGGGISGLSAACELATRRVPFILLEASERTGGLVRTERVNGFTIDSGADSMLAAKPAALRLCEELGLGRRLMTSTPPRTAYVHARGRLLPIAVAVDLRHPDNAVRDRRLRAAAGTCAPRACRACGGVRSRFSPGHCTNGRGQHRRQSRSDPDDESVADFYRRHFGPETVGLIAQPLLGGIHAGDVERLSVGAVAPRLVSAARSGSLFTPPASSTSAERRSRYLQSAAWRHGRARRGDRRPVACGKRSSADQREVRVAHRRTVARRH